MNAKTIIKAECHGRGAVLCSADGNRRTVHFTYNAPEFTPAIRHVKLPHRVESSPIAPTVLPPEFQLRTEAA